MTAVEWLSKRTFIPLHLLDQAKAMEREQINDAFESGYVAGDIDDGKNGLEYYNSTYKGGSNE